jgi:hypothetical protein
MPGQDRISILKKMAALCMWKVKKEKEAGFSLF